MMEYAKVILPAVSAWKELFRKELVKCFNWLDIDEKIELYCWANEMFCNDHPEILSEVFAEVPTRKNYKGIVINMPNPAYPAMKKTG